ncbi:MAG: PspC domain-containing protein [Prolixibacteraceae bacterium]|nr:PspC domain-containing protein [Prolixibacteraceae bacterium]
MNNIYKSNNRVIAGVCGGLAEYFRMEVTIVRIITFILVFIYGLSIWVYIILWIIMPSRGGSNRGFFGIGGGSRGGGCGKCRH